VINLDISKYKPGVAFYFQANSVHKVSCFLSHVIDLAGNILFGENGIIIFVQFHHHFVLLVLKTGATNICNFA